MFILISHIIFLISMTLKMSAIHRLDRLVSGLLILARSASKADFFRQQVKCMLPYPSNGKKSRVRIVLSSKTDCFTSSTILSRPYFCHKHIIRRQMCQSALFHVLLIILSCFCCCYLLLSLPLLLMLF